MIVEAVEICKTVSLQPKYTENNFVSDQVEEIDTANPAPNSPNTVELGAYSPSRYQPSASPSSNVTGVSSLHAPSDFPDRGMHSQTHDYNLNGSPLIPFPYTTDGLTDPIGNNHLDYLRQCLQFGSYQPAPPGSNIPYVNHFLSVFDPNQIYN